MVRQSLGRRPSWGRRGEGKTRPSRTEVPWTSENRSMRSARGRMSRGTQGLAPSRHSVHTLWRERLCKPADGFSYCNCFPTMPHWLERQGSARFQDLNSTLLKCHGLNRRSLWSVTPGSSQGPLGQPLVCRGTVMCGICGAEGRCRPPGVRVISPNPAFPQHLPRRAQVCRAELREAARPGTWEGHTFDWCQLLVSQNPFLFNGPEWSQGGEAKRKIILA